MTVVMEIVSPAYAGRIVFRNHDRREDDDQYLNNIKLDVSNFNGRLDSQYYLDWVMSLERYFKWYGMFQKRRIRFTAMKLVG